GVVRDGQHLRDLLVGQEAEQSGDVAAAGVASRLGQHPHLRPVDTPGIGEDQDPLVVGGGEQVVHLVVGPQCGTTDPLAAAALHPVLVGAGALGVAAAGDGDDHVLVGDQVLVGQVAVGRHDAGAAVVAVLVDDLGQFLADDGALPLRPSQDVLV